MRSEQAINDAFAHAQKAKLTKEEGKANLSIFRLKFLQHSYKLFFSGIPYQLSPPSQTKAWSQILSPRLGDIVDSGRGLLYWPAQAAKAGGPVRQPYRC
jgi:hypothetical protein